MEVMWNDKRNCFLSSKYPNFSFRKYHNHKFATLLKIYSPDQLSQGEGVWPRNNSIGKLSFPIFYIFNLPLSLLLHTHTLTQTHIIHTHTLSHKHTSFTHTHSHTHRHVTLEGKSKISFEITFCALLHLSNAQPFLYTRRWLCHWKRSSTL